MQNYINFFKSKIKALDKKQIILLSIICFVIFIFITLSIFFILRPNNELLYSGLDRDDIVQIGVALQEAGVNFDVSSDGTSIYVKYGASAQARMVLAEQSLPQNANSGYELYDKLGSLGLTSFMQEVTKVRALEGELTKSILMMKGIKAARVHLVLSSGQNYSDNKSESTASVIIKSINVDQLKASKAIQYLLASSVPQLKTKKYQRFGYEWQNFIKYE
jgi:flagellar M-ring protein FliF